MPIHRISSPADPDNDVSLDVFHVQESIEVYDGSLALAIDHLLNHIKTLISLAYMPGSKDLEKALERHPALRRIKKNGGLISENSLLSGGSKGRPVDRVLLAECQQLLESMLEIAHLAAWPETADEAQVELEALRKRVPFLDFRYDNDPYPSDIDHEDRV